MDHDAQDRILAALHACWRPYIARRCCTPGGARRAVAGPQPRRAGRTSFNDKVCGAVCTLRCTKCTTHISVCMVSPPPQLGTRVSPARHTPRTQAPNGASAPSPDHASLAAHAPWTHSGPEARFWWCKISTVAPLVLPVLLRKAGVNTGPPSPLTCSLGFVSSLASAPTPGCLRWLTWNRGQLGCCSTMQTGPDQPHISRLATPRLPA